jgi:mannosyl-3-phosphoglycerate phosphatase
LPRLSFLKTAGGSPGPPETAFSAEITGGRVEELRAVLPLIESALAAKVVPIMEMPLEELVRRTELPAEQAERARLRRSSLPFAVSGADGIPPGKLEEINRLLAPRGCGVIRGKRFFHLTALGADKGAAVRRITEFYHNANPCVPVVSWGVGDSYNDLPLFSAVDAAVYVGSDPSAVAGIPGLLRTRASGPEGFTEAVKMIAGREGYSTF